MSKKKGSKKLDPKEVVNYALGATGGVSGLAASIVISKLIKRKKK